MFRITYLLQQKYKSKITGYILSWQNGKLEIRDQHKRIYTIREDDIVSIIPQQKPALADKTEPLPWQQEELF